MLRLTECIPSLLYVIPAGNCRQPSGMRSRWRSEVTGNPLCEEGGEACIVAKLNSRSSLWPLIDRKKTCTTVRSVAPHSESIT